MNDTARKLIDYINELEREIRIREKIVRERRIDLQEFCPHESFIKEEIKYGTRKHKYKSIVYRCIVCHKEIVVNSEIPELESKVRE